MYAFTPNALQAIMNDQRLPPVRVLATQTLVRNLQQYGLGLNGNQVAALETLYMKPETKASEKPADDKANDKNAKAEAKPVKVVIDFDGLTQRIVALPPKPAPYDALQAGKSGQGTAHAQRRLAATPHELQRLNDKLDFANATRPQLDIARIVLAATLLPNLAVHVAQTRVGVIVEILAEDERRDHALEFLAAIPGKRPRLEPCVALPGAPLLDEVLLQRTKR